MRIQRAVKVEKTKHELRKTKKKDS